MSSLDDVFLGDDVVDGQSYERGPGRAFALLKYVV